MGLVGLTFPHIPYRIKNWSIIFCFFDFPFSMQIRLDARFGPTNQPPQEMLSPSFLLYRTGLSPSPPPDAVTNEPTWLCPSPPGGDLYKFVEEILLDGPTSLALPYKSVSAEDIIAAYTPLSKQVTVLQNQNDPPDELLVYQVWYASSTAVLLDSSTTAVQYCCPAVMLAMVSGWD